MRVLALLLVLLLPGCATPEPTPPTQATVAPMPPGGDHAPCAPSDALQLAVNSEVDALRAPTGLGLGLHRVAPQEFVWVWAAYDETLREDRVRRLHEVQVFREAGGRLHACTSVDILTPTEVDAEPRTYEVGVRIRFERLPEDAPVRVVVNWLASCATCGATARGNATGEF